MTDAIKVAESGEGGSMDGQTLRPERTAVIPAYGERSGERARWDLFYLIVLTVYTVSLLLPTTVLEDEPGFLTLIRMARYGCYLAALVRIVHERYTSGELTALVLLFVAAGMNMARSDSNIAFVNFLMMAAAWHMDSRRILKVSVWIRAVILTAVVFLSQAGVLEDFLFDISTRARHFLGFTWTMYAPTTYLFILLCFLNIRRENMTIAEILLAELINYRLYVLTDTRSVFLVVTILLILAYLMGLRIRHQKKTDAERMFRICRRRVSFRWKWIAAAIPAVCCTFAILIHVLYSRYNPFLSRLNGKMSNRLQLGHAALEKYGVSLFGQPVKWVGWTRHTVVSQYNYVDCSYMQLLIQSGMVMLFVVVMLYSYLMYRAAVQSDRYMQLTVLMICVFCISEPRLFEPAFNPFLLMLLSDLPGEPSRKLRGTAKRGTGESG